MISSLDSHLYLLQLHIYLYIGLCHMENKGILFHIGSKIGCTYIFKSEHFGYLEAPNLNMQILLLSWTFQYPIVM